MKVDVESCPACGAKNSKFVQQCYRCHAELPWSPNYKAPEPKPAITPVPPPPSPKPANPGAPTPAVTLPPTPSAPPQSAGTPNPLVPSAVADGLKRVPKKIEAPIWGLVAIGCGVLVLGMSLMAMMLNGRQQPATIVLAPTPEPTVITTPIAGATPAPSASPVASGTPTETAAPSASASPVASGTPAETPAPETTPATPQPDTTPAVATPAVTALPTVPPHPVQLGPNFQAAYAKLEGATNATQAQKQAYWKSIQGTQVAWTGHVVDADSNGLGKVALKCAPNAKGADVQVTLDGTQNSILGGLSKGQKVTVQGILQDHSASGYVLDSGRIVGQG